MPSYVSLCPFKYISMYILLGLSVFLSVSSPFVLVYSFVELPTAKRSFIKLLLLSPFICVGALCHWRPPTLSSFLSTLSDFLPRSPKPKEPPALANQLLTKHQPRPTFSNFFFFSLVQSKKKADRCHFLVGRKIKEFKKSGPGLVSSSGCRSSYRAVSKEKIIMRCLFLFPRRAIQKY